MIVVYAGVQADEPGRTPARLPRSAEDDLLTRLRGLLQSLRPSRVVGALASGADILVARAALSEGIPLRVVLPFAKDEFRRTSVEPRGERWLAHFDRILDERSVDLVEGDRAVQDTAQVFREHNLTLLEDARALVEGTDERIWVVAIRPTPDPDALSVSDDLVLRAEARGHLVLDLAPVHERVSAFVVMPYGIKKDVRTGKKVDCDPAFHRIYRPLLEDADISWSRADLETDSGIIHAGMLAALANADLVLADLTTINFNVAYELGVRHVFADRATVLINPHVTGHARHAPPFDVQMSRAHSFERGRVISDLQAETAIRTLRPVVRQVVARRDVDSPAHAWFDLAGLRRPYAQRDQVFPALTAEAEARGRIGAAIKSSDPAEMRDAADWVAGADGIGAGLRRRMQIELAIGLHAEEAYADARALLGLAQPRVEDPLHRVWLQENVMVHRRLAEDAQDPAERRELLRTAGRYLEDAERAGYADSETYGIWGGLIKRELELQLGSAHPAVVASLFQEMASRYRVGFEADPSYYTGVNLLMALRLGGLGATPSTRADFDEVLTVTRFLNRRAIAEDPTDYWALATRAELTLHACLADGRPVDEAVEQYATAVRVGSADQLRSTRYQLHFLSRCGDPHDVIERVAAVFPDAR